MDGFPSFWAGADASTMPHITPAPLIIRVRTKGFIPTVSTTLCMTVISLIPKNSENPFALAGMAATLVIKSFGTPKGRLFIEGKVIRLPVNPATATTPWSSPLL